MTGGAGGAAEPVRDSAVSERFAKFWGLRVFTRESGDGVPLLMIMGLGGNTEMWGPTESVLAEGSRTIVFDAPGTGRSRISPVPLVQPLNARFIARLLDELGHDRVDVMGYSLGGATAQQFAKAFPHRVRRMALVATLAGWGSAPPDPVAAMWLTSPLRLISRRVYEATTPIIDGSDRLENRELMESLAHARHSVAPSMIGWTQQLFQAATWSSLRWAGELEIPTLVVSAEKDRVVPPANGMLLAHRLPHARLKIVPDEGHLMLFDPASALPPLLRDYFTAAVAEESEPWQTGRRIDDGDEVERALRAAPGIQPTKALGCLFRAAVGPPSHLRNRT